MDTLFSFKEASEKLRISTQTLRKLVKNNQITFIRITSRRFFREKDINDFLENNKS